MASSSKSPSVMKESSLRSLKQKMQKNNLNQAPYDIRSDSYKSPPQRMSGPTVDMINNTSPYDNVSHFCFHFLLLPLGFVFRALIMVPVIPLPPTSSTTERMEVVGLLFHLQNRILQQESDQVVQE